MSDAAPVDNHDPQTDTVLCPKCKRTVRRSLCTLDKKLGKPVCGTFMARSCSVAWLAEIDRQATGRADQKK